MRYLSDGSQVVIRRTNDGFNVEHIATAGVVAKDFHCDTFAEAKAAFYYGPERW